MNTRWMNLLWGIVLIVAGLLFLAQNLDAIPEVPPLVWVGVFGLACVLFAITYAISGPHQWGWLFPALISGGVALTILLTEAGVSSSLVGVPVLASIGVPFHTWAMTATRQPTAIPFARPMSTSRPRARSPSLGSSSPRANPRTVTVRVWVPALPLTPATMGKKAAKTATRAMVPSKRLRIVADASAVTRLSTSQGNRVRRAVGIGMSGGCSSSTPPNR